MPTEQPKAPQNDEKPVKTEPSSKKPQSGELTDEELNKVGGGTANPPGCHER